MNQYFNDKLSLFHAEASFDNSEEKQQSYFQNDYFFKILWKCDEPYDQVKCRQENELNFWSFYQKKFEFNIVLFSSTQSLLGKEKGLPEQV